MMWPVQKNTPNWESAQRNFDAHRLDVQQGPIIFKVDNVSCSFVLLKENEDYFRKGVFHYFVAFLYFSGLCVEKH
jgi:hypothetical protein